MVSDRACTAAAQGYTALGQAQTSLTKSQTAQQCVVGEPVDFVTQTGTERTLSDSRALSVRLSNLLSRLRGDLQNPETADAPYPIGTINDNLGQALSHLQDGHNILTRIENYLF